ncbi:MAG: hypothetical protein PHV34_13125 [Verrucomicrobiae bacterium]|nr:hypothetical protein [Verrucomicrobiae bacterium]
MKTHNLKISFFFCLVALLTCNFVDANNNSPSQSSDATFGLKLVLKVLPKTDSHLVELRLENNSERGIDVDKQVIDNAIPNIQMHIIQWDSKKQSISGAVSGSGRSPHESSERIASDSTRLLSIKSKDSHRTVIDLDKICPDAFNQNSPTKIRIEFSCPHVILGYTGERPSKKMNDMELISNSVTIDITPSPPSKTMDVEKRK